MDAKFQKIHYFLIPTNRVVKDSYMFSYMQLYNLEKFVFLKFILMTCYLFYICVIGILIFASSFVF